MNLPFDSAKFEKAIDESREQFNPPGIVDNLLAMIKDYKTLLNKKSKITPKNEDDDHKRDIEPRPGTKGRGAILEKHKKKIKLESLPKVITYNNETYPVRENVNNYFNEIANLEKPLPDH